MQKKLTLINTLLTLTSMGLAAAAVMVWMQPEYPSRVDPRGLKPEARTLETTSVDRPNLERNVVENILTNNLFRKQRKEYTPPPPSPSPAAAANAAQAATPQEPTLPAPNVALKGTFMANGTRVAFLEGKYPVRGANNQMEEKPLKRKGYYLGDAVGQYRVKTIEKTQVSLSSPRGSIMTIAMPQRSGEQSIKRRGTHFSHKDKNARKNRQVEVEKVITPPRPRIQPPAPQASVTKPKPVPQPTVRNVTPKRNPAPPPATRNPALPRISGASSPTQPRVVRPHVSGR